jgi:hypothetical protein
MDVPRLVLMGRWGASPKPDFRGGRMTGNMVDVKANDESRQA